MSFRAQSLDLLDKFQVVRKGQLRVAAPNHMNLGNWLVQPLLDLGRHLIHCQRKATCLTLASAKGAKSTTIYANVAVVNVLVIDPVGFLAVASLAHEVGQKSYGEQILRSKEPEAVVPG
jgi:hypothetical protein